MHKKDGSLDPPMCTKRKVQNIKETRNVHISTNKAIGVQLKHLFHDGLVRPSGEFYIK